MKTNWLKFVRKLCLHREGYCMRLKYDEAVNHPMGDGVARTLYMSEPITGHCDDRSWMADEFAETERLERSA